MAAIMWQSSLVPFIDANGNPYSGAKAYFFEAGTTTPRATYVDGDLTESHDHPVIANSGGMFPAIFLQLQGNYRVRILASDDTTIWDIDGIATPQIAEVVDPGAGDTDPEFLYQTGDFKIRFGTGTLTGFVRSNGRTIGSASSGATERAHADCEDLFTHLWTVDTTLAVSGGRGANAAADWAANKTIALPDARSRALIGLGSMGASAAGILSASYIDGGETADTLGATSGLDDVALTEAQLAVHDHTASTTISPNGSHSHTFTGPGSHVQRGAGSGVNVPGENTTRTTDTEPNHGHTATTTVNNAGSGQAHNNMQPSLLVTVYLKL